MINYFYSLQQLIDAWVQFEPAGNELGIYDYLDMVTGMAEEDNQ